MELVELEDRFSQRTYPVLDTKTRSRQTDLGLWVCYPESPRCEKLTPYI